MLSNGWEAHRLDEDCFMRSSYIFCPRRGQKLNGFLFIISCIIWSTCYYIYVLTGYKLFSQTTLRCVIYTKNKSVIEAWAKGQKASGSNLKTDGTALWSYDLVIGYRSSNVSTIYKYSGKNSVSKTTARHVGQAIKHMRTNHSDSITLDVLDPHTK